MARLRPRLRGTRSYAADVVEGVDLLLGRCGRVRADDVVVIVCDTVTRELADLLAVRATLTTPAVEVLEVEPAGMHGQEPPLTVVERMRHASLCVGVTSKSMAHTQARAIAACHGARYLSLPDYSLQLLADPALRADYERQGVVARAIATLLTAGKSATVTSRGGTSISFLIDGRRGNCCPGYVDGPGQLGSPPDIEANISPIETSAEGVVVVDGSVPYPGLGLLDEPLSLVVRHGAIVHIDGSRPVADAVSRLFDRVASPKARILAECGVGLNDRATLCGVMLVDEGTLGTMHFGFGSNVTVGGRNDVPFHLDFVFRKPSLIIDGRVVLQEGLVQAMESSD